MGSNKERMFELERERADEWIRQRASDEDLDETSEEYEALDREYWEWQESIASEQEFEAELEWLRRTGSSVQHENFVNQLFNLRMSLLKIKFEPLFVQMSYAYAITLLETYLADTTKSLVATSDLFFRNAINKVEELKKARYSLEQLTGEKIDAKGLAVKELSELMYHNIPKIKRVLEGIIGSNLELKIDNLVKVVEKRHDIVHRNGFTKEGVQTYVSKDELLHMITQLEEFAKSLQVQINEAQQ